MKQVLPFLPEFIQNSDGNKKNDCEQNATKRILPRLKNDCKNIKIIILADNLSARQPIIEEIEKLSFNYIMTAKPGGNEFLFNFIGEAKKINGIISNHEVIKDGIKYKIRFVNNVPLNSDQAKTVNYIELEEVKKNGKKQYFSWITNIEIDKNNCFEITRGGRSRWHIENQTFNTLKNEGYNLEHNYGHGNSNTANIFAAMMFLAFFVDQLQEISCENFQKSLAKFHARKYFWEKCIIRLIPAIDSGAKRARVPFESEQGFRSKAGIHSI
jgi:hypothetical protein